jgi:hypothetical protein
MALQRCAGQRQLRSEPLDSLGALLGRRFLEGPVSVQEDRAADGAVGTEARLTMFHIQRIVEESPPQHDGLPH